MNVLELTAIIWLGSLVAGLLGALTGLGGGVVVVPLLTLGFGIDIRYAIGASLVSVIATSSGAAASYVKEGYTNLRVGMLLEVATTVGALGGAAIALWLSAGLVAVFFGVVLIVSAALSLRPVSPSSNGDGPDRLAMWLRLDGSYPSLRGPRSYHVRAVPCGFLLMLVAGILSGLLGIGSGAIKVLAMDRVMRIPFKVSTTTSNFMIGVTAAASAGVYLRRGYVDPGLAMPVILGILPGAMFGTRLLARTQARFLRWVFALVTAALAVEMIYNGATGRV